MERRLAAILTADVVGYTRLMGEDEAGTLAALNKLREESLQPSVTHRSGRVIKRMGDGWIVEFPNVSDAVTCAIEIQDELSGQDLIRLRIGVHIGDVTIQEDDIYGDGINVAARLEALAEPGQVLISDMVHHSLDNKTAEKFVGGGARNLKGIGRPVGVWHWGNGHKPSSVAEADDGITTGKQIKAAFLGLESDTENPEKSAIVKGVSEAIRIALTSQSKISVITKEQAADLLITGTLQFVGNRYRATIRMQDLSSSEIVKAEKFDGRIDDIFEAEDALARQLYTSIRFGIFQYEQAALSNIDGPFESLETETLLIRAAPCFTPMQTDGYLLARHILSTVLERDPGNSSALSMTALTHGVESICGWREASDEDRKNGMRLARHVTRLYPRIDFAHAVLSWLSLDLEADHRGAILAAEKALEVTPNYVQGLSALGNALVCANELESGLNLQFQAVEAFKKQPLLPSAIPYFATGLILATRFDEALEWCRRADQLVVDVPNILLPMITAAIYSDNTADAQRYAERLISAYPDFNLKALRKWPLKRSEDWNFVVDGLRRAGLPE